MPPLRPFPHRDGRDGGRFAIGDKVYVTARELPVRAGCYADASVPSVRCTRSRRMPGYSPACRTTRWHGICCRAPTRSSTRNACVGSASGGWRRRRCRLAKLAGMTAIGRRRYKGARAEKRSAPIMSSTGATRMWQARVSEITGGIGVDLILDAVGSKDFEHLYDAGQLPDLLRQARGNRGQCHRRTRRRSGYLDTPSPFCIRSTTNRTFARRQ